MIARALIIGYGSIGMRHARVLEQLGLSVAVVSRRGEGGGRVVFPSFAHTQAKGAFDYVVIANETASHIDSLTQIACGHDGLVMIEKPLFAEPVTLPRHQFRRAGVGYNLRFHPVVTALRAALDGRHAEMVDIYVGQWLGDWRPSRAIAESYSASRAAGGGVLRDLSHELDLATWLFGPWKRVAAVGGRLGSVTIDADDGWGTLLSCERCPVVTLQMNCLDRHGRRTITVQVGGETLRADLVAGTLEVGKEMQTFVGARDATYRAMHQALIEGSDAVCTLDDGLRIVDLIAAIEQAGRERRWVERTAA
jgi:predicted dehydrogenase